MLGFITVSLLAQLAASAPTGSGAICTAAGDPFYRTFDGAIIEFQGRCNYKLTGTPEGANNLPAGMVPFTILVHNQKTMGSERSYTYKVHIDTMLHRFSLRDNGKIYIDDIPRTDDAAKETISDITLKENLHAWKTESKLYLKADNMFTLIADLRGASGRHVVEIQDVNPKYAGYLDGICGNMNGNKTDDMFPKQLTDAGTPVEIGNSWIMDPSECV